MCGKVSRVNHNQRSQLINQRYIYILLQQNNQLDDGITFKVTSQKRKWHSRCVVLSAGWTSGEM